MRNAFLILAGLVVVGAVALFFFARSGLTLTLTREQIQTQLESKFPVQRSVGPGVPLTLENPRVQLQDGSDRMSISMNVKVDEGPLPLAGTATVSGSLTYDPDSRAFFLKQASLDEISPRPLEKLRPVLSAALSEKLDSTPLKGPDDNRLVSATLVSVVVKDGKVQATFALK